MMGEEVVMRPMVEAGGLYLFSESFGADHNSRIFSPASSTSFLEKEIIMRQKWHQYPDT